MEWVVIGLVALAAGVWLGRSIRPDQPDAAAGAPRRDAPDTANGGAPEDIVGEGWEPADDQSFRISYVDTSGKVTDRPITVRVWRRDDQGRVRLGATCGLRKGWRIFAAERIIACHGADGLAVPPRAFLQDVLGVDIGEVRPPRIREGG